MEMINLTVSEIRNMAVTAGIEPGEIWETVVYPALSASLSTDPGVVPNTSHSW